MQQAPGLPCALYFEEGQKKMQISGASRRENAEPYPHEVKGVNRAVYDVTSFRKLFDLGVRPFTHARIIRGLKCLL